MNSFSVVSEQATSCERLRRSSTGERTLSRVHAVVPLEIFGPGKATGTLGAHRRLDARVLGYVLLKVVTCRELGRAVIAGVLMAVRVFRRGCAFRH